MGSDFRTLVRATTVPALLLVTVWAYAPSLDGAFVYEDLNDPATFFQSDPSLWRPLRSLTALTYAASHSLSGGDPWGYRWINLLWHGINGVLLWGLIHRSPAAWFWLGLFLLHPLNTQAVAYISARADLVMTSAVLAGVWCGVSGRLRLAWLCALLAVLAKESGVVAFALIPLAAWMRGQTWTWRQTLAWWSPGVLAVVAVAEWLRGWHGLPVSAAFTAEQLTAVWHFVGLMFAPFWLTPDNDLTWAAQWAVVGVFAWLVVLAASVWRRSWLVLGMTAWVLVALSPRLVIVLSEGIHEHHWYLPMSGLILLAAWRSDVSVPAVSAASLQG